MSHTSELHVVVGAGPVGATVALQLAEQGHQVRLLTRSGSGPEHPMIDRRSVDVSRAEGLDEQLAGAVAVYHCAHGSAYDAKVWRAELPATEAVVLDAAGRAGAVVVFPESLYSYGEVEAPMTEDLPRDATRGKLGIRAELLRARDASPTPTVSVAASDFFGPSVLMAHAGDRVVPKVLDGKTVNVVGSLDQPHSFTYVPDLARAMITAARTPELWNSFLHAPTAPAVTQREMVRALAAAAGVPAPRMWALPAWVLKVSGLVSGEARELAETSYQFSAPFVLDSSRSEALLGQAPTPLDVAAKETVTWWRSVV
ncbi:NAD-dependent epimerase/dehydratase family protein [Marmoricola sp. URHB0036]|uniref:NAD-dependent epimerase/dehydratase family protein n=1 Tax=Marmoricola sp. URHB0036 TaxID=1298863 RepID=UPI0003F52982|nr:NAD-dependent epimerase/dehydratase family protein [Marmoricola sp. URHB0036]